MNLHSDTISLCLKGFFQRHFFLIICIPPKQLLVFGKSYFKTPSIQGNQLNSPTSTWHLLKLNHPVYHSQTYSLTKWYLLACKHWSIVQKNHEWCSPQGPCMCVKSLQSCPTLCDPIDHSPPGSSVHGILQARILAWIAMLSSRGFSPPKDQTHITYISFIGRGFFTTGATWEAATEGRRVLFVVRFQFLLKESEEAPQGKGDLFWVGCSFCSRIRKNQVALLVKNPPASAGDMKHVGSIPGWGSSPGGGNRQSTAVFLPRESP